MPPAHACSLSEAQAARFVRLPLRALEREYPNHLAHLLDGDQDVQTPRSLHPIFYGCFDWHSAAHGFWLLARCVRRFPDLAAKDEIAALFDRMFTLQAGEQEAAYFLGAGRGGYERPYGWGWLLALVAE